LYQSLFCLNTKRARHDLEKKQLPQKKGMEFMQ
jgi:hypothetical protein